MPRKTAVIKSRTDKKRSDNAKKGMKRLAATTTTQAPRRTMIYNLQGGGSFIPNLLQLYLPRDTISI